MFEGFYWYELALIGFLLFNFFVYQIYYKSVLKKADQINEYETTNLLVLLYKLSGLSRKWLLSFIFPPIWIPLYCYICIKFVERFDKSPIYGLGFAILPGVVWPLFVHTTPKP